MTLNLRTGRVIPVSLGVALVAVIVAAGLAPQTGAVPAQGNCEYAMNCVSGTGLQWYVFAAIAILVVAALAAALILLRRRRSPPASGVKPYEPPSGPTPGALGSSPPPPAASPAYLESPEDVGAGLPVVAPPVAAATPVVVAGAAGAAAGAAAATAATPAAAAGEGEPDIDSLMAELDKISGEILKRPKSPGDVKPPTDE
jgi:hypothetical protein